MRLKHLIAGGAIIICLSVAAVTLALYCIPAAAGIVSSGHGFYGGVLQYTRADYDYAVGLMTPGYETLTVAAFNSHLPDWKDEVAFHTLADRMDRLLNTYPADKPNADFIRKTLCASFQELSARHYSGSCTRSFPTFWDSAEYTRYEDVFGDPFPISLASVSFGITYQIQDEQFLTISDRDRALAAYETDLIAYLGSLSDSKLKNRTDMARALEQELVQMDQRYSSSALTLTTRFSDYYFEDFRG